MLGPTLLTRIVQRRYIAGDWIARSKIRPFEAVAFKTGIGEIFQCRRTAMLDGDDVVWLVRNERRGIWNSTVFAKPLYSLMLLYGLAITLVWRRRVSA
jgi:hypothetical protein